MSASVFAEKLVKPDDKILVAEFGKTMIFFNEICTFIKNELATAVKYAEGRELQIDVKTENDLKNIFQLIRIKLV